MKRTRYIRLGARERMLSQRDRLRELYRHIEPLPDREAVAVVRWAITAHNDALRLIETGYPRESYAERDATRRYEALLAVTPR